MLSRSNRHIREGPLDADRRANLYVDREPLVGSEPVADLFEQHGLADAAQTNEEEAVGAIAGLELSSDSLGQGKLLIAPDKRARAITRSRGVGIRLLWHGL